MPFSIENLKTQEGYSPGNKYFSKTFTFPADLKKPVLRWLKKHQDEIVEYIIRESTRDD